MPTCYYCGANATTTEHVPPRGIFPKQKDLKTLGIEKDYRSQLITVPSCEAHNTEKSKDDEFVMTILSIYWNNNQIAFNQVNTKILRMLQRNPNLLNVFFQASYPYVLNGQPTRALTIDRKRFDRAFEYCFKGIYFFHYKRILNKNISIHSNSFFSAEFFDYNDSVQEITSLTKMFFHDKPRYGENPEVFYYQIDEVNDNTVILMNFFEGFDIVALCGLKIIDTINR